MDKKKGEFSIETLIAQDMSKNSEFRTHSPNIMAQLMGLDQLPKQSQHSMQEIEIVKHKELKRHDYVARSNKALLQKPAHDPLLQRPQNFASGQVSAVAAQAAPTYNRYNSERSQKTGGKDGLGNKRKSKPKSYPEGSLVKSLTTTYLENEEFLECEIRHNAKMGLICQKFLDAKRLACDQRNLRSREFTDAVKFLQSNEDAFLKLLEEPNLLFSKNPEFKKPITILKSCKSKNEGKDLKEEPNAKELSRGGNHLRKLIGLADYNKHSQEEPKNILQHRTNLTEAELDFTPTDPYRQYAALHSHPRNRSSNSVPTQIVVLKPSSHGTAQNIHANSSRSYPPNPSMCLNDPEKSQMDTRDEDSSEFQDARLCPRREPGNNVSNKTSCINKISHEQFSKECRCTKTKGPHKEIARHVGERVMEERTHCTEEDHISRLHGNLSLSNRTKIECRGTYPAICSHEEVSGSSGSDITLDVFNDSTESVVNREAKKQLLERWKSTCGSHGNLQQKQEACSTLRELLGFPLCSKEPAKKREMGCAVSVRGLDKNEASRRLSPKSQIHIPREHKKKDGTRDGENVESNCSRGPHTSDLSLRSLQRSRSIPASACNSDDVDGFIASDLECRASVSDPTNTPILIGGGNSSYVSKGRSKCKTEKSSLRSKLSCLFQMRHFHSTKNSSEEFLSSSPAESLSNQQEPSEYASKDTSKEDAYWAIEVVPSMKEASCIDGSRAKNALSSELTTDEFLLPNSPVRESPVFESTMSERSTQNFQHPSPVSVLGTHSEDVASTKDFKQTNAHCQGFQQNGGSEVEGHSRQTSCSSPPDPNLLYTLASPASLAEDFDIELLITDSALCPPEHQTDLLYFKKVLKACGFTGNIYHFFGLWHSPTSPLDPSLFEKIERDLDNNYLEVGFELDNRVCEEKSYRGGKSERQLLFDCINELLLNSLSPILNHHPWMRNATSNLRQITCAKQLLQELWAKLYYHISAPLEDCLTLENIIANDLSRDVVWMDLVDHMEAIALNMEKRIINDMIEGVIYDLVS